VEVQNVNQSKVSDRTINNGTWARVGNFFRMVHTGYGVVIFALLFLLIFPLLCIPILIKSQFKLTGVFNRWWARLLFTLIGVPFRTEYRFNPDPRKQYIFCPNHFSYLDIPTVGLNKHNTIFVGKSAMEKIPLFGWMYSKLHITVDRSKLKSRYTSILRSMEAIDEGKSLVIYPEGGIITKHPPHLASFKDGAFRVAIEKQIPIVPVTIPYNWILLPDNEFVLHWHKVKVIFHAPIHTSGLGMDDIDRLKQQVRLIISDELHKHNKNEN
jgi:1-acyl-sn-glycerol-3-phosphate acyltransferase